MSEVGDTVDPDRRAPVEHPELIVPPGSDEPEARPNGHEGVSEPAKVMRIGAMTKQLLEELRNANLDQPSRERLRAIYATAVNELSEVLSPDLRDELEAFALPFGDETPSELELRVAQAQLVGWLEGLFQGIQLTLLAQQMTARAQLENMRGKPQLGGGNPAASAEVRPGTYL